MKRVAATAAGALLTLAATFFHAPPAGAETVPLQVVDRDLGHLPAVTVTVSGPGLAGADLPASAFTVEQGGHAVPTTVTRVPTSGLEVVLVVDTSGSMAGAPMVAAKQAAVDFVHSLPAGSRVAVVGFGPRPVVALPFTTDASQVVTALQDLRASGETALYDAVVSAAAQFDAAGPARRAVVLLSDGGDTVSHASLDDAVRELAARAASLSAVSLLTPETDGASLARLAAGTKGQVIPANDPGALHEAYAAVAGDLIGRYRLTFTPSGTGQTALAITVRTPAGVLRVDDRLELPAAAQRVTAAPATAKVPSGRTALLAAGAALFFLALTLGLGVLFAPREGRVRLADKRPSMSMGNLTGFANRASAAAERALDRRGRRRRLDLALDQAGLAMRAGEAIVLAVTATATAGAVGLLLGGVVGAALLGLVALLGCWGALVVLRERRRRQFADQLDGLLQMLAGSLRTGYGLAQALDTAAQESEAPTSEELRRLTTEVRLGRDLGDSLDTMAARVASEDFAWIVQAIRIHREIGGDLAEVLDRVSETIRARNHLARQVKTLTAEGRMSAYVLLALPFGLVALISVSNPSYLGLLTGSGMGRAMVGAGVGLVAVGALWLRHLVRPVY